MTAMLQQMSRGQRRRSRGVSLIEALVALAVMAFGMLGVVGMQATLRNSSDQSKQRSEALRLAQDEMERLRIFGQLSGAPTGEHDYAKIASAPASAVVSSTTTGYAGNATFLRSVDVVDHPAANPAASAPRMKTVTVKVTWQDREFDASQSARDLRSVTLSSVIAELNPELGAGLGLPTDRSAPQRPGGRNIAIPPAAIPGSTPGTSVFTPPGSSGVTWVFRNSDGLIAQRCVAGNCSGLGALLLSGYVRFATGGPPTAAEAENSTDPAFDVGITINQTWPVLTPQTIGSATGECFTTPASTHLTYVAYFCAVPVAIPGNSANDFSWSGTVDLTLPNLAMAVNDDTATRFKVCRYTTDPSTDTPAGGNAAHPLTYNRVGSGLLNQNFLIISAGSGSGTGTANYTCPLDDTTSTPLVDTDTKQHQPR
jgi:type IV pilus modification protein PilV